MDSVYRTGQSQRMSIRKLLAAARERAGIAQDELADLAGWDKGHVSNFENEKKGASVQKIDALIAALKLRMVLVPLDSASPDEINALSPELRSLLSRVARLLPILEQRSPDRLADLVDRIESYERIYLPASAASAPSAAGPMSQDQRQKSA
jgi:transcriptional regulator with XRE-family HTH domain